VSPRQHKLRLVGALSGAVFAVLALVALMIHAGPSSGDGVTVVDYYSRHATATPWAAALVGIAALCLVWFAETFAGQMSSGPIGVASAAATAALYLVAVGCWEMLGEIYGGVDLVDVSSEGYSDAHVLHVVGVGAAHMGNFPAAAFVGTTAAAMRAAPGRWRVLALLGIGFFAVRLISALIELASTSHWSDVVAIGGFLTFLVWTFAISVMLVVTMWRAATAPSSTAAPTAAPSPSSRT
jgi:hypothetical protein